MASIRVWGTDGKVYASGTDLRAASPAGPVLSGCPGMVNVRIGVAFSTEGSYEPYTAALGTWV